MSPEGEKMCALMMRLCSRSERSAWDVRTSLRKKGIVPDEIDEILSRLTDERFLDDERFARAFVNDKVRFTRWGRLKISAALKAKHIPADIIRAALTEISSDDYRNTLSGLIAHALLVDPDMLSAREGRERLMRRLMARGYEPALIIRLIREAQN